MQKRINSCYGMCALFVAVRLLLLFSSIFPELGEPTHRNYVTLTILPTETKRKKGKHGTASHASCSHSRRLCIWFSRSRRVIKVIFISQRGLLALWESLSLINHREINIRRDGSADMRHLIYDRPSRE